MEKFYSYDLKCQVQQVQKRTAKRLFYAGVNIYLQSCNMAFDNIWQKPIPIDKSQLGYKDTFDRICNCYKYYNCDCERGYYIRFYVKVTDLQN